MTKSNSAMRSTGKTSAFPYTRAMALGLDATTSATKPVAPSPRLMNKRTLCRKVRDASALRVPKLALAVPTLA
jgi:hypothetical protein